jgi:hypothetical protein
LVSEREKIELILHPAGDDRQELLGNGAGGKERGILFLFFLSLVRATPVRL